MVIILTVDFLESVDDVVQYNELPIIFLFLEYVL